MEENELKIEKNDMWGYIIKGKPISAAKDYPMFYHLYVWAAGGSPKTIPERVARGINTDIVTVEELLRISKETIPDKWEAAKKRVDEEEKENIEKRNRTIEKEQEKQKKFEEAKNEAAKTGKNVLINTSCKEAEGEMVIIRKTYVTPDGKVVNRDTY